MPAFLDLCQRRSYFRPAERFAQFAASSSDGLWIRDAATLDMEYVSPAIQTIYGIASDGILGDIERWVELILPEDRETAIAHIKQAQAGASVTHEFRIHRKSDGALRWIRNTDFPLCDGHGRVQRVGGIAVDVTEAKTATERQDVLIAELQHRTRNLIAVVRAIAADTMDQMGPTEAFRLALADRLSALSRVRGFCHALSLSQSQWRPWFASNSMHSARRHPATGSWSPALVSGCATPLCRPWLWRCMSLPPTPANTALCRTIAADLR